MKIIHLLSTTLVCLYFTNEILMKKNKRIIWGRKLPEKIIFCNTSSSFWWITLRRYREFDECINVTIVPLIACVFADRGVSNCFYVIVNGLRTTFSNTKTLRSGKNASDAICKQVEDHQLGLWDESCWKYRQGGLLQRRVSFHRSRLLRCVESRMQRGFML